MINKQRFTQAMTEGNPKLFPIIIYSIVAALGSTLILLRFLFTKLGMESFGRVWHFYIDINTIGLRRRTALASIIRIAHLDKVFIDRYMNAFFIQWLLIMLIVAAATYFMIVNHEKMDLTIPPLILLSPAFVFHQAYNTGSSDVALVLLATASINCARNNLVLYTITALGTLFHESFILFTPFIAIISAFGSVASKGGRLSLPLLVKHALGLAFTSIIIIILSNQLSGINQPTEEAHNALVAPLLRTAAHKHQYWSGYYEIFRLKDPLHNSEIVSATLEQVFCCNWVYLVLPLTYLILLLIIFWQIPLDQYVSKSSRIKLFIAASCCLPLCMSFLAIDYYRYISLSCSLVLLAILTSHALLNTHLKFKSIVYLGLCFTAISPFGAADISWPLPFHQLIFQRFFN